MSRFPDQEENVGNEPARHFISLTGNGLNNAAHEALELLHHTIYYRGFPKADQRIPRLFMTNRQ